VCSSSMLRVSWCVFCSMSLLFDYMCMRLPFIPSPWSIAGVPSSQALPGFLITAPPSVCVPAVLSALAVWIQNPKKKWFLNPDGIGGLAVPRWRHNNQKKGLRGGGDLGEYIFLKSADSSSLSKLCLHWLRASHVGCLVYTSKFEKLTSAPLTAPVVKSTPVPLLYHVRTFYTVHQNSPTTHPSQPTYTMINELQKRKRKRNKGGSKKKRHYKHTHKTRQSTTDI